MDDIDLHPASADAGPDDPVDEPDGATAIDPSPRTGRRTLALVLAALAAVALVVVVVVVRLAGSDDSRDLDELRAAAGRFGEALVTYDYHDPRAHRDAVLGFATGSFRDEYEAAFDQGLGKIITEVKATSKGFVKDVYLSEVDEERAQAIVVVDIEHSGAKGPNTLYDVYFRLTLVHVGDRWKVDQVTDLNFDSAAGQPSVTTATTGSTTTSLP